LLPRRHIGIQGFSIGSNRPKPAIRRILKINSLTQFMKKLFHLNLVTGLSIVINFAGVAGYLLFSVQFWPPAELADIPGAGAGDPIIWGLVAIPLVLVFFLVDFGLVIWNGISRLWRGYWVLTPIFILVPFAWMAAIQIEFSHHWLL